MRLAQVAASIGQAPDLGGVSSRETSRYGTVEEPRHEPRLFAIEQVHELLSALVRGERALVSDEVEPREEKDPDL